MNFLKIKLNYLEWITLGNLRHPCLFVFSGTFVSLKSKFSRCNNDLDGDVNATQTASC